jgi:disulfide bond formation protein DsbB
MMTKLFYRKIQFALTLVTVFVLFFSFYAQYVLGLEPCPLCLMQRGCVFVLLGLMGLSLRTIRKARAISLMQCIIAFAGLFFALRQVWLQSLPAGAAPACMPGLDILIHYFPWQAVAKALLWGTGDCAETTSSFLGLSLAGWSGLYFLFMMCTGLFFFVRMLKTKSVR